MYNIVILLPAHLGTEVLSKIRHTTLFILSLFQNMQGYMQTKLLVSLLLSAQWTADKMIIYKKQLLLLQLMQCS